jgi:hypothetical protein
MNSVIEKYIKYELEDVDGSLQYAICDFQGNTLEDLDYLAHLLEEIYFDGFIDRVADLEYRSWHNDSIAMDKEDDVIGITSIEDIPEGEDEWENVFNYTLGRLDFEAVVQNYKKYIEKKVPFVYLVKLADGRVFLQEKITDNNLELPEQFPSYIEMTFFEQEMDYEVSAVTSQNLFLFYSFIAYFDFAQYLEDNFADGSFDQAEEVLLEEGSSLIKRVKNTITFSHAHSAGVLSVGVDNLQKLFKDADQLESKQVPEFYFVQKDNGTIVVQERLDQ